MTTATPAGAGPPRTAAHRAANAGGWWADVSAPARTPLTADVDADVCVVGLGGSGLAAVHEAVALGARVVGVDAGRIAGAAAGRNGGLLLGGLAAFHHDVAQRLGAGLATTLYRHTLDELARMRRDTPNETWWPGSLRIAGDDAERADCARQFEAMRADALPVEPYAGPEGEGLRFPADGATHPVLRVHRLAAAAEASGATLFEHAPVRSVVSGAAITATGATVRAPVVVVCADGALGRLLPSLAARVRPVRLQMLATAPADDVSVPCPVYARYGHDYWQQLPDGRVFLGGGRDAFAGAEETADDAPTEAVQAWLERRLRDAVGTRAPVTHRWAATVGFTADGLPVAEPVHAGVWGVGGYSGTGNVVGALCARGAVRRALGASDAWLDALDAARGP